MRQSNIKIAVTGGIGSGKSTVMRIIEERGYPAISCDKVYAQLLEKESFLRLLASEFGDILTEDKKLDRAKLSKKVFESADNLKKLNEITHPKIMEEAFRLSEKFDGLVFFEVPLLFEGGFENLFDDVAVVMRDKSARIDSVIKRDNLTKNQIQCRINSQVNYDILDFAKYYVIHNNGNLQQLNDNVLNFLLNLKEKYKL
jgi:dephospho-CoA kinase